MNKLAQSILSHTQTQQSAMETFLEHLVKLESPSLNPELQKSVLEAIANELSPLGFNIEILPGKQTGDHLFAYLPGQDARGSLLMGHCDTVWPVGTLATMPITKSNGKMTGPGIFDMKAGLVQMIFALNTLHALGLTPEMPPTVLINSDEEIGSNDSYEHIIRIAQNMERAFILEPAFGPTGKLKTRRKGVGKFEVLVKGKASHAGLAPEEGVSAILELAHVTTQLFALNDFSRGISVNVGVIKGGLRPNVIAPTAYGDIDVRVTNWEDGIFIEHQIKSIQPTLNGTEVTITGEVGRKPLEFTPRNQNLWSLAHQLGGEIGLNLEHTLAGGASDGNITSEYTATLDGLGPVGDGAHAIHEFIFPDQMPIRTALLALLIMAP